MSATVNQVTRVEALRALLAKAKMQRLVAQEALDDAEERVTQLTAALAEAEGEHTVTEVGVSEARRRQALRELGSFNAAELAAALHVDKRQARKWIDGYVETGVLKHAGRAFGSPTWEYVKPTEPGAAAELSIQRHRDEDARSERFLTSVPIAGTGQNRGLPNGPALRAFVAAAESHGWTYHRTRRGHGRLSKGEQHVTVPTTPRNEGDAVTLLRQKMRTNFGEDWV